MENIKQLTKEEKIEKLRAYMSGEILDDDLAFNVFLLICPAKNFSADFFSHEKVMYSSLIEFISIVGALKPDMIDFVGHLLGVYEACFRYCVPVKLDNQDINIPEKYLKIFALLDFQRIAKLYDSYTVIPETNKYTDAYKVIYPFLRQFSFYESIMTEGGFGDGSGR